MQREVVSKEKVDAMKKKNEMQPEHEASNPDVALMQM